MYKYKIGIICTKASSEKKKDELLSCYSTKRWWLLNTPKKYCINRLNKYTKKVDECTAGDVSVAMYIKENYKDILVDIIPVKEITIERLKSNDMNFLLIYDLLEAFHNIKDQQLYKRIHSALSRSRNIYPPYSFQRYINDKSKYIKDLGKKKIKVIPTFKCNHNDFMKFGSENGILRKVKSKNWDEFIVKPLFGQESIGFKKFSPIKEGEHKVLEEIKKYKLNTYKKIKGGNRSLPGVIFQQYIKDFDTGIPEIRMYYICEKYQYSIVTSGNKVSIPSQEGGTKYICPSKFKKLKQFSYNIIKKLPKIKINSKIVPKLLIRVDIACGKDFKEPWLVNEVEFVPSLYIEDIRSVPEPLLAKTIVQITKKVVGH
jgi:hypothetical protein